MASQIVLSTTFDPKAIAFGPLEKNKKGGKIVYLGLGPEGKDRLQIQTPAMVMPFGVTPYQDTPGGDIQSYSVDVSFRTADVDPKVADFQKKIEALDEYMIDVATKNSQEWFGKTMTKELVSEFYRKLLNNKNPQYPPVLKVKVGVGINGEPSAQFYDETRNPVPIEYLGKGSTVKMICEVSSVWFVNKVRAHGWSTFLRILSRILSTKRMNPHQTQPSILSHRCARTDVWRDLPPDAGRRGQQAPPPAGLRLPGGRHGGGRAGGARGDVTPRIITPPAEKTPALTPAFSKKRRTTV